MNKTSNSTENNFQYPKYTRKLFLGDDENNDSNPVEHNQEAAVVHNQIMQNQNPLPQNVNQYSTQYSSYIPQSPYVSNTASLPPDAYSTGTVSSQQPYHQYVAPHIPQQSYMNNSYIQYPPVSQMPNTPNYVQMMSMMQQQIPNHQQYTPTTSLRLKKQGVSLDDYDESDGEVKESSEKKNFNETKTALQRAKPVPYAKNKRPDTNTNNRNSGKNHKKPVISYEDNYIRPSNKTSQKVAKKVISNKEVKSNSFADKYKKMMERKEQDNEENTQPQVKTLEQNGYSSDSDAPPEELKIEKPKNKATVEGEKLESLKQDNELNSAEEEDEENVTNENPSDLPTFIPGTAISLTSEEDIKDWQQQRRINWLLKVSNKKNLHNSILAQPENFKDSTDEQVQKFIKFQKDNNLTMNVQEKQKNTFREFGKIRETVKKMFQQIDKDNHQNNSTANIASMKMFKIEEQQDNLKILPFIKLLGDLKKLDYKLTDMEKEKLFGNKK